MIPLLIYLLSKKMLTPFFAKTWLQIRRYISTPQIIITGIAIVLLFLIPVISKSQPLRLRYKIVQGGDTMGWLILDKNVTKDSSSLSMISQIKKRILFLVTVLAKESAVYKNGQLVYSSQFRKTNDETKVDKQTKFIAGRYVVTEDGELQNLSYSFIGSNLLSLYFHEPVGITTVYCDKQSCFVDVTKTNDGGYKVKFPDGNSNCFYYANGVCTKILISHTFYSAQIILN